MRLWWSHSLSLPVKKLWRSTPIFKSKGWVKENSGFTRPTHLTWNNDSSLSSPPSRPSKLTGNQEITMEEPTLTLTKQWRRVHWRWLWCFSHRINGDSPSLSGLRNEPETRVGSSFPVPVIMTVYPHIQVRGVYQRWLWNSLPQNNNGPPRDESKKTGMDHHHSNPKE